ncbi:hypothetical protein JTB14_032486 [Gonioctena quinquepunctata]|nr:hypothetical protein JTB14_032486 [Gonioctena quinquepunctata]
MEIVENNSINERQNTNLAAGKQKTPQLIQSIRVDITKFNTEKEKEKIEKREREKLRDLRKKELEKSNRESSQNKREEEKVKKIIKNHISDKDLIEAGPSRRGNTDFSSQNSQMEETSGHTDRDKLRGKQTNRSKWKTQAIERKHCSKRRTNTTK